MTRDDVGPPSPGDEPEPPVSPGREKLRTVLVVLSIFGLPAILAAIFLFLRTLIPEPPWADQPGGLLAGSVASDAGVVLEGVDVHAYVLVREGSPELVEETVTDARGTFQLEVPPLADGCYLVQVGGRAHQPDARYATLAEEEPSDLAFELVPAAEASVRLSRRDGSAVGSGSYYFTLDSGPWPNLGLPSPSVQGTFQGGSFRQGGLAPGTWTLRVELASGEILDYEVTLDTGHVELELPPF